MSEFDSTIFFEVADIAGTPLARNLANEIEFKEGETYSLSELGAIAVQTGDWGLVDRFYAHPALETRYGRHQECPDTDFEMGRVISHAEQVAYRLAVHGATVEAVARYEGLESTWDDTFFNRVLLDGIRRREDLSDEDSWDLQSRFVEPFLPADVVNEGGRTWYVTDYYAGLARYGDLQVAREAFDEEYALDRSEGATFNLQMERLFNETYQQFAIVALEKGKYDEARELITFLVDNEVYDTPGRYDTLYEVTEQHGDGGVRALALLLPLITEDIPSPLGPEFADFTVMSGKEARIQIKLWIEEILELDYLWSSTRNGLQSVLDQLS